MMRQHGTLLIHKTENEDEIRQISKFVKNKLYGLLQANTDTSVLEMESDYDMIGWIKSKEKTPLSDYLLKKPIQYEFFYSNEQLKTQSDQFKRYGTDHNALSKIVTRVSNVESLFRKIRIKGRNDSSLDVCDSDQFVRYALSN